MHAFLCIKTLPIVVLINSRAEAQPVCLSEVWLSDTSNRWGCVTQVGKTLCSNR